MSVIQFKTDGSGYWSAVEKAVTITDMVVDADYTDFGELRVVFDLDTWNTDTDGLIYTDKLFLKELRAFLDYHGLPGSDVTYSEQGMQGVGFVSLDIGRKFIKAWDKKFNITRLPFKTGMEYMTN